jgi:hypothetical protein
VTALTPDPQRPDSVPPAAASEAVVVHSAECDCWQGRACNCDCVLLLARPVTPPHGWRLWYRRTSKDRWVLVGNAPSEAEVDDQIGCGGRHHGQWYSAPAHVDPNASPRPR